LEVTLSAKTAQARITTLALAGAASIAAALSMTASATAHASPTTPARAPKPAATAATKPGLTAKPIVLDNNVELSGYDAATDASGTSYIGWISDNNNAGRKVHLCTLPPGARKCKGGVQTIDSLGDSSAQGLTVLVSATGEVTLVWFHDTTASEDGPQGSEIASSTSDAGGPLSPPVDMATAPSFGSLLDARLGPGGQIWTVTESSSATTIEVRTDLFDPSNPYLTLKPPYDVEAARLRFHGNNGVLAIQKGGAITVPVDYASYNNGHWSAFRKLARTWTSDAIVGLAGTNSGIRLVTSVNNADYYPVMWSWNGSTFTNPTPTGDFNNCSPNSHDLVSDGSGRLADVSRECDDVAIANLPDTRHAAVVRFDIHGTFAGGAPQITTTPRGTGWVAWSMESAKGDKLLAAPFVLPGRIVTAASTGKGNRVTVSGPQSCLPPAEVKVGVKANPAKGWHAVSSVLRLGSTVLHSATLNGAALKAGSSYTLSGTVKFADGGAHTTVTAKLKFKSCPTG
jgi:hypothetical protein